MFSDVLGPMTQTPLFAMTKHCFAGGHCKLESRIVNSRPSLGAFLPPWGCPFSTFWSPGGSLRRPWEITCLFALIAQAWAWRSFQLYSGHEARYTNRYQSGLDQYLEARYILSGISLDLIFFW